MTDSLGDVIAAQVRRYRKQRDLSIAKLSEECLKIAPGSTLTTASLGNIERGQDQSAKRRRRDVTVEELLTIAAALRVPPVMLMCNVESEIPEEFLPGTLMRPKPAADWIAGHAPIPKRILELRGIDAMKYAFDIHRNSAPLRMVETYNELERSAWAAIDVSNAAQVRAQSTYDSFKAAQRQVDELFGSGVAVDDELVVESQKVARAAQNEAARSQQDALEAYRKMTQAFRDLGNARAVMDGAGMSLPDLPAHITAGIERSQQDEIHGRSAASQDDLDGG